MLITILLYQGRLHVRPQGRSVLASLDLLNRASTTSSICATKKSAEASSSAEAGCFGSPRNESAAKRFQISLQLHTPMDTCDHVIQQDQLTFVLPIMSLAGRSGDAFDFRKIRITFQTVELPCIMSIQ